MLRSAKEEWERRKTYLIRSLFDDLPALSPINESQESVSPTPHDYRCEINLPELIIEKEPKKPNLHDEPDDFYDKLEKEMKQLYRKDFLDIVNQPSTPRTDFTYEVESFEELSSINECDRVIQEYREREIQEINNEVNVRDSIDTFRSTESEQYHEQILTQVEVYQEKSKKVAEQPVQNVSDNQLESGISDSSKSQEVSTSSDSYQRSDNRLSTIIEREVSEDLEDKRDSSEERSSSKSHSIQSQRSLETMRRRQSGFFRDSFSYTELIPAYESGDKISAIEDIEVDNTTLPESILSAGREMEIAEAESSPIDSHLQRTVLTSTPKSSSLLRFQSRKSKRCKSRLVSYSTSSSGIRTAKCNAALQTSFSDNDPDLSNIWNNFFIGTPTVYKICKCSNHVCS